MKTVKEILGAHIPETSSINHDTAENRAFAKKVRELKAKTGKDTLTLKEVVNNG